MKQTQPTEKKRPQADIKWIRLQEICLTMCGPGKILHVHGSTDLPIDLRAAVSKEGPRIDVMMNLLYNKNLDEVIESLAHEMAHIVLKTEEHGPEFNRAWMELSAKIIGQYQRWELVPSERGKAKKTAAGVVRHARNDQDGARLRGRCPNKAD